MVRHERQQFRGGDRVWRESAGASRDRRRRERTPFLAALQRRSTALQHWGFARGLLLPITTERTYGARIPPRKLSRVSPRLQQKIARAPVCLSRSLAKAAQPLQLLSRQLWTPHRHR